MNSNAHFEIARNFRRADKNLRPTHPMRRQLLTSSEHELLRHQQLENDGQRGGKRLVCDLAIMMMGIISAFVPMGIAANAMMGN